MKINDHIVCINDRDSTSLYLNYDYQITDINEHGNIQVAPWGSYTPLQHYYKPERFNLIIEDSVVKKIDISKEYKTRQGDEVKLFVISDDPEYPVVGQYKRHGFWENQQWTIDGFLYVCKDESSFDLVEVVSEIYLDLGGYYSATVYDDQSVSISYNDSLKACLSKQDIEKIIKAWNSFS